MFDELKKYKTQNHFFYKATDNLKDVCNAPVDKSGVYLIYALAKGKVELIYIGRSGKKQKDGKIFIRKAGLGGIKDRLVNGHQFGKIPRHKSWANQMRIENIDALDIYWHITHDQKNNDCPREIESYLLDKHLQVFGRLPRWNNEV